MTVSLHDDEAPFSLPPGYALHLLLLEDDAALSHALVKTLRTHHPAVHLITASSVEQALGTLQAYAVNLIVTDIHLPGVFKASRSFNASRSGAGTEASS